MVVTEILPNDLYHLASLNNDDKYGRKAHCSQLKWYRVRDTENEEEETLEAVENPEWIKESIRVNESSMANRSAEATGQQALLDSSTSSASSEEIGIHVDARRYPSRSRKVTGPVNLNVAMMETPDREQTASQIE